jgi:hypothetical protein
MRDIVVSDADDNADFGSVTILFNQLGGLQVRNPSSHEWKYVKPQPDSAIITIGDSLVKLLGERVYSGLHRVVGMFTQISQTPLHLLMHRRPPRTASSIYPTFRCLFLEA